MKRVIFLIFALITASATAQEFVYTHEKSGLSIKNISGVNSIESSGDRISFQLEDNRFMVTGLLLPASKNSAFPMAEKMNELLSKSIKKRYPDLEVTDRSDVNVNFANKPIMGSLYQSRYNSGTMDLCDLNVVHPVENNYYLIITLTTADIGCADHYDTLMSNLRSIYQQVHTTKI
ncbi:hypothetical protein [Microbulbifer hydrolyticus]|uniref:DUF1795 domain-containing protein n=1 Tax=Microbulbifer hydrolyticus TaxID=48074 RepID=A0A6P1TA45_9GAMM|nr:hypothetical protein [Microbulbifer hydrolyticus]MBB5213244.1 hypothetical protein [Microbulbifer hydrolyticus]QHQ38496.1 hypothetical protein GTQ55_05470 [Microbulbifer hydrolyticus]